MYQGQNMMPYVSNALQDRATSIIIFFTPGAVTWPKYCRYGVKLYPINQSINHPA